MWHTRPVRLPENQGGHSYLAGVCEGIAVRYQIDPVVVRIVFVVGTISFGVGIAAYLLTWLIMPRYSQTSSPLQSALGNRTSRPKDGGVLGWVLLIAFLIAIAMGGMFNLPYIAAFLLFFGGGWYLLHRKEPLPPAGLLVGIEADKTSNHNLDISRFHPLPGHPMPQSPPAWDPLGTVPEAWHLSVPPETKAKPKRAWKRIIIITAAILTALSLLTLAALFFWGASTFNSQGPREGEISIELGTLNEKPLSLNEVKDYYRAGVGTLNLDLSAITDVDSVDEPLAITASSGIGTINLTLPDDTPVDLSCSINVGTTNCSSITSDPDAPVKIALNSNVGTINVRR